MSLNLVWPDNTQEVIDAIRGVIGREITLNVLISGQRPGIPYTANVDPITGSPLNSFSGTENLPVYSGVTVLAHVHWKGADDKNFLPGGIAYGGDCLATIANSGEARYWVEHTYTVEIDDKTLYIQKFIPRGKPTINRYTLVLKEEDDD